MVLLTKLWYMQYCMLSSFIIVCTLLSAGSNWIPIKNNDITSWYTNIDICQLEQESGDVRQYHLDVCKAPSRMLACNSKQGGIGLGGPKRNCYPPFKSREFFWKGRIIFSTSLNSYPKFKTERFVFFL